MASYLITGGCGFIGSHLVEALLSQGHEVVVLDDLSTGRRERIDPQVRVVQENVTDRASLQNLVKSVDGVFHLAAVASVERCNSHWLRSHRTNASGTIAVLEAARMTSPPVPVVWASSAAVYGLQRGSHAEETHQPCPLSPYGADKLACELHGTVAANLFDVPNIGLRFFNVYGPGQDPASPYSGVISIFMDKVSSGGVVTINGDGAALRDFVYVTDVVKALLASMRKLSSSPAASASRILNVCTGNGTQIGELLEIVGKVVGRDPIAVHGPVRPGDIRVSLGSPRALEENLGVRCETTVAEGLSMMLNVSRKK